MRKTSIILISIIMLFSLFLAACGNGNSVETSSQNESNEESQGQNESNEESAEKMVLRIGIGLNEEHPHYKGMVKFKEVLEEETNGKFDVQLFPNASLGDDREMMENLQMGTLEVTIPAAGVVSNFVPEFEIFNFPFLFPNEEVADKVLDGDAGKELLEKLNGQSMVGLNYWEQGFFQLSNNKHEVKNVEDFKGLKIRSIENQVQLDTLRALGTNPTPMAFSELFTAMQQGAVDGQQNPIAIFYAQKFHEVQKYLTLTNHVYGPSIFLVSEIFWEKLTSEDQELVQKAADIARDEVRKLLRESNKEQLKELQDNGLIVTELEPEEKEKLQQLVQPVIEKYSEELGKDLVDKFYKAVEEAQ